MYVIELSNGNYLSPNGGAVNFDQAEEFNDYSEAESTALEYNKVHGEATARVVASAIVPS